jgi:hypothetical protein
MFVIVQPTGGSIMLATQVQEQARKLHAARGEKALPDVAQKAAALEEKGEAERARNWRRIEAALRQMQGPHAS